MDEPRVQVRRRARNLPAVTMRLPDHPGVDDRPAGTYYLHLAAATLEELPSYGYWSTDQATTAFAFDFATGEIVGAYDVDVDGNVVPGSARGQVPDAIALAAQGHLEPVG